MAASSGQTTPRAQAKRNQIRSAAQRLFLRDGFANTSTDAIAAEAHISKQTLYSYYTGKEELLADVLQQLIHNLSQTRIVDMGALTPGNREALRDILMKLAQYILTTLMQPDYLALARMIIAETPRFPHLGKLFRSAVPEQVLGRVAAVLDAAQAHGAIRPVDSAVAARMFVGALLIDVLLDGLLSVESPPTLPPQERVAALIALYMQAIVI